MAERPNREGQQVGNYRLERLLGRGGFAEVYLGYQLRLKRQAAIKILHAYLSEQEIDAFQQEAQIIAGLEYPHIVRVLDFDVQNGVPFLVMDYLPNGTLRQRHRKGEQVPLPTVVSYVKQVAEALHYAHEQRLIHRDVKPENMLIGRRNEIVLSDFGIAAIAHSTSSMTAQASIGTVPYMAPEQIQEHPRAASDQYALGIVVYEWLSGKLPFDGSFTEIFAKHLMTPPPSLRQKVPELSAEVEQVVLTALAKDPGQRFGSIQAFATALESASQATQQPAGAAYAETVLPQPSPSLPPTVLAAPPVATPADLKTPPTPSLAPTVAVPPPVQTPPSTTVTPPTVQAVPPPTRPGKHYLTAVILGVFLSFVSMLFMDLIPIWVGVDPSPTPLQVIPPLVMSLILGGILGKRREAYSAILLAGLLIGVSGDMYMVVKYGPFLPYFPPYAWALIVTDPLTCGLLSWLAAWIRTRTVSPASLLSPPTLEQNKRPRSPTVTVFLILLALILFGGVSFDIYHNVTMAHSGTIGNLSGVAWSGSQFVAVGGIGLERAKGFILTSPDGHTWTPQSSGLSDLSMLWGVAWSGSQFVAVGAGGTILSSPDGSTWTPQSSGASSLLDGVVWSGSQFVVVGWGTTIVTSPDGSTWTPQSSGTSPYRFYDGVAWSGSQFVVVGDNGILTSPDGSTWTPPPSNTSQWLDGVVWSGSQFVAVGASGTILTSPDGSTWTPQSSGTSQWLHGVVWSGSQFVVVGASGTILTSPDGHTWTPQSSGTSQPLNKVAWSGSQFVAVGYGGVILTSPDGSTWT